MEAGFSRAIRPGRDGRIKNVLVYRGEWYGFGMESGVAGISGCAAKMKSKRAELELTPPVLFE